MSTMAFLVRTFSLGHRGGQIVEGSCPMFEGAHKPVNYIRVTWVSCQSDEATIRIVSLFHELSCLFLSFDSLMQPWLLHRRLYRWMSAVFISCRPWLCTYGSETTLLASIVHTGFHRCFYLELDLLGRGIIVQGLALRWLPMSCHGWFTLFLVLLSLLFDSPVFLTTIISEDLKRCTSWHWLQGDWGLESRTHLRRSDWCRLSSSILNVRHDAGWKGGGKRVQKATATRESDGIRSFRRHCFLSQVLP